MTIAREASRLAPAEPFLTVSARTPILEITPGHIEGSIHLARVEMSDGTLRLEEIDGGEISLLEPTTLVKNGALRMLESVTAQDIATGTARIYPLGYEILERVRLALANPKLEQPRQVNA